LNAFLGVFAIFVGCFFRRLDGLVCFLFGLALLLFGSLRSADALSLRRGRLFVVVCARRPGRQP